MLQFGWLEVYSDNVCRERGCRLNNTWADRAITTILAICYGRVKLHTLKEPLSRARLQEVEALRGLDTSPPGPIFSVNEVSESRKLLFS